MKLFFIVGEDSGDALAAPLIHALKNMPGKEDDDIKCLGIGGPMMEEEGFQTLLPMDQISVVGIWEVVPKLFHLIRIKQALLDEIENQQPDAVITVDFPDFNFNLAKTLKKRGVYKGKVIHYVSPSVWAWRAGRAKQISMFLDGIMCLFPMEPEYFTKHGLMAKHVGHPLVISSANESAGETFRRNNDIPLKDKTLGLFFGSRENEFKFLGPVIKGAARLLDDTQENLHLIAPTLPRLEYDVQEVLQGFDLPVSVSANSISKWDAIKACDVAIAASGTMALELAYAGVPHVVCYKVNPLTALILKFLIKIKYVHLVNILLKKDIVPEFLQEQCTAENVSKETLHLLNNEEARTKQIEAFKEIKGLLAPQSKLDPSQEAASFIFEILSQT